MFCFLVWTCTDAWLESFPFALYRNLSSCCWTAMVSSVLIIFEILRVVEAAWSDSTSFNLTRFQSLINSRAMCRSFVYRPVTATTMDLAARELQEGAPHGTVVLAEEMTKGRGRTGKWISPKEGNLYLTLLLRAGGEPHGNGDRRLQANFAAPLSVAEAIKDVEPKLNVRIRWPQSVEVENYKVSGSLVEVHRDDKDGLEHYAIGIGVNVNADFCTNQTFSQDVTSLRCVGEKLLDREQLLGKICDGLDEYLLTTPSELKRKYLAWPSVTAMNSEVSLHDKTTKQHLVDGVVKDLTPAMNLLIQVTNGSQIEVSTEGMVSVMPRGRAYQTELWAMSAVCWQSGQVFEVWTRHDL